MIKQLKLSCFRQFESRTFEFTARLNALIGQNEAGKTTTLEALVYAWFGANSLRQPVAEVVTWGQPLSKLKVELVQEFEGVTYFCKRGPNGAEVRYNDVTVTGQSEVTKLFETLLGVSATVASRLMLANQTDLRGALQGGPGKAVALIERLANLDLIDMLLEDIRDRHPNGNCDDVVTQREAHQQTLKAIDLTPPDTATVEARIAAAEVTVATLAQAMTSAKQKMGELTIEAASWQSMAVAATQETTRKDAAKQNLAERTAAHTELASRLAGLAGMYSTDYADLLKERAVVQKLRLEAEAKIEAVQDWNSRVPAILGTLSYTEDTDLAQAYASLQDRLARNHARRSELTSRLAVLRATKITETACGLCGKDLQEVPEVVAKNVKADQEIAEISAELQTLALPAAEFPKEIKALEQFDSAWSHHTKQAPSYAIKVPAKWGTFTLDLVVSTSAHEDPDLAKDEANYKQWVWTVAATEKAVAEAEKVMAVLQVEITTPDEYEAASAYQSKAAAAAAAREQEASAYHNFVELKSAQELEVSRDRFVLQDMINEFANRKKMYTNAQTAVANCTTLIEKTERTNSLIAILKAAKPKLAEKLWNSVLAAVSTYFSTVRGTDSKVTRESNRFRVNGQAVEGLSGSTQDALGLAIRVALMQVFIPGTRLLVLDEPGAACDDQREASMLGMINGAGFEQVLLVTHSHVADALADNMIEV